MPCACARQEGHDGVQSCDGGGSDSFDVLVPLGFKGAWKPQNKRNRGDLVLCPGRGRCKQQEERRGCHGINSC